MVKRFADSVHLRQYSSKAGIVPRTMNAVTAPAWNRLRSLPIFADLVDQFATLSLSHWLDLLGH
jgi:hypothetical protein